MNKVSPEFLLPDHRKEEIVSLLARKKESLDLALNLGDYEEAERIFKEANALATELSTFKPGFDHEKIEEIIMSLAANMQKLDILKSKNK
jgi:hypothetical protein